MNVSSSFSNELRQAVRMSSVILPLQVKLRTLIYVLNPGVEVGAPQKLNHSFVSQAIIASSRKYYLK